MTSSVVSIPCCKGSCQLIRIRIDASRLETPTIHRGCLSHSGLASLYCAPDVIMYLVARITQSHACDPHEHVIRSLA